MDILVNGSRRVLPDGSTVAALVDELGFGQRQVVVELNGEAVERSRFGELALRPGDRVEVVRAVAGG